MKDVAEVGGKNASLGEMIRELSAVGVRVPDGCAVTATGYRHFIAQTGLEGPLRELLSGCADAESDELQRRSRLIRDRILGTALPVDLANEIVQAYRELARRWKQSTPYVVVRSSATVEDLPNASFAGQQESFLGVHGEADVLAAVRRCFASLFTARSIHYRRDLGIDDFGIALSVGIQRMVRADRAASGVIFTLDPESGFREVVLVSSVYGLGESIVQGRVGPDELYVHKPTLREGFPSLLWRKTGAKESKLVYDDADQRLKTVNVAPAERERLSITQDEALALARWAMLIEDHYSKGRPTRMPMDIEWAKDGDTGELFIVQARPETVHSQKPSPVIRMYHLEPKGASLCQGIAVGEAVGAGAARVVLDPRQIGEFRAGEVLVTETTDPDWEPIMKKAAAIITERGGRTSHAAIVARELGIPAIVGATHCMTSLPNGAEVTVSCSEGATGRVYAGHLPFTVEAVDPATLPATRTKIFMNLAQPERAFQLAQLPCDGVGLARMEFIFAGWVGVHPLALTRFETLPLAVKDKVAALTRGYADKSEYFVDRLAQGIAVLAGAFWPRPVVLRFSDFKTNEYARLLGGEGFEPKEENPMLGWRGASRYYHPDYKEGFLLEVRAIRRVRETLGLTNLHVMVPFCRTPEEGRRVLDAAREGGLVRGEQGLECLVMAEIPANVILADRFAELFDGFSIGSNDLTQLVLGVDRDSERVAPLFDERNEAVLRACTQLIQTAHRVGRKVGICGQAPSDHPEFAAFLVEQGIDSISLTPDALVATKRKIIEAESHRKQE